MLKIYKPTIILDELRMMNNLQAMKSKADLSEVVLRPHFKTHHSAEIGKHFAEQGIDAITVSSVDMAEYFSKYGWQDILIAFPLNLLEINRINELASKIKLSVLVDSLESTKFLIDNTTSSLSIYIKIDTGYHRSGILYNKIEKIIEIIEEIKSSQLHFKGILTHNGHSYHAKSIDKVLDIYDESAFRMNYISETLVHEGYKNVIVSTGDTPCCATVEMFYNVTEIRPGNFIFYDVMQASAEVCSYQDIAVAVACPVVGKYEDRKQVVLYGGAIHFSKDYIIDKDGQTIYGYRTLYNDEGFGETILSQPLISLSQEHGILQMDKEGFENIRIGDIVMIHPVHSCLTATQYVEYLTFSGKRIKKMQAEGYF